MKKPHRSKSHKDTIELTQRESVRVAELIASPPPRNERFISAQARHRKLSDGNEVGHVTPVGGNVFLDLGFPADEAARLKEETDAELDRERRRIAANRQIEQ